MKKLVNVLMIVIILMAAAALTMGILLFHKRELLIGRTRLLEMAVIGLAATVEEPVSAAEHSPEYPERDIDRTDAPLSHPPLLAEFWTDYPHQLELPAERTLDLRNSLTALRTYYLRDEVSGRIMRDPLSHALVTRGPGTMRDLLQGLVEQSGDQLNRFQSTRQGLSDTREELVSSVSELNTTKHSLRTARGTIREQGDSMTEMHAEARQQQQSIEVHKGMITALENDLDEAADYLALREDVLYSASNDIARLARDLASYREIGGFRNDDTWPGLTRGAKGTVSAIDPEWGFVVLSVTDAFISEYQEAWGRAREEPTPDLVVYRGTGDDAQFITKVRLDRLHVNDHLAVAGILRDWQQTDIRPGDGIIY